MTKFKQHIQNRQHISESLSLMLYAMDNYNLNEELITEMSVNDFLSKFGLKFHKEGPGLVDYVVDFVKGTGKIFVAALKGDKEEVKRIASGITKERVIDFLLKLDMVTLHILTGPIHAVDAITGWDLWADISKVSKNASNLVHDIWKTIKELKEKIQKAFDNKRKEKLLTQVIKLEQMVPKPKPVKVTVKA
jgi:hypothetical protein